jgi:hypothetical protein
MDQVRRQTRRNADKEKRWHKLMAEYGVSGKSAREFCARNKIKESRFYYWQRALQRKPNEPTTGFVELRSGAGAKAGAGITLWIDERVRIALERGFDDQTLHAALACLGVGVRASCCR